jgi:cysteinyl-tRNA synthetase
MNWLKEHLIDIHDSSTIIFKGLSQKIEDNSKIEDLISARAAARSRKDWKESDRLRAELESLGVVVNDTKKGTTWQFKR